MKHWLKLLFGQNIQLYSILSIAFIIIGAELIIGINNYESTSRPIIRRWRYLISDMSCHYAEKGDALPSAEEPSFSPETRSIFFHETSCRGGLTSRQACSVEAAARTHPQRKVFVLFSASVSEDVLKNTCLAKLLQFSNVKFARIHLAEYTRGTILESMLLDLEDSKHPVEHSSDILRILTLNKWGGMYLDTDMIVVKSLESLPVNWIAKQADDTVASGILSFGADEVGKNITSAILKQIFESYDPYEWSANGPRAIQKVIQRMCPNMNSSITCKGVEIFPYQLFYAVHYTFWKYYFKLVPFTDIQIPYSYHMWNFMSSYQKIEKGAPYEMLARKYCPSIFEMYGDEFGV